MAANPDAVYLFESRHRRHYSARRVQQIVQEYVAAAGMTERSPPALVRASDVDLADRPGLPDAAIQLISVPSARKSQFRKARRNFDIHARTPASLTISWSSTRRTAPQPNSHQALILHNPAKPRSESPFTPILFQSLECSPTRILHLFLGIAAISEHGARSFQAPAVVLLDQPVERGCVSRQSKSDQFFVTRNPFRFCSLAGGFASFRRLLPSDRLRRFRF